jgi:hypothetical protein
MHTLQERGQSLGDIKKEDPDNQSGEKSLKVQIIKHNPEK